MAGGWCAGEWVDCWQALLKRRFKYDLTARLVFSFLLKPAGFRSVLLPTFFHQRMDISTPADVRLLIDTFYTKVQADDLIGYIFNDIAQVNWPHHLPVMYAFWEFMLLGTPDAYRGNPMQKHADLHRRHPLRPEHFDRWVSLFQGAVDELFEGPTAESAKFRAFSIAETWKPKFAGPFA